jgi:hypothetical protein
MTDLGIDILFKDYKYKKISPKYSIKTLLWCRKI